MSYEAATQSRWATGWKCQWLCMYWCIYSVYTQRERERGHFQEKERLKSYVVLSLFPLLHTHTRTFSLASRKLSPSNSVCESAIFQTRRLCTFPVRPPTRCLLPLMTSITPQPQPNPLPSPLPHIRPRHKLNEYVKPIYTSKLQDALRRRLYITEQQPAGRQPRGAGAAN